MVQQSFSYHRTSNGGTNSEKGQLPEKRKCVCVLSVSQGHPSFFSINHLSRFAICGEQRTVLSSGRPAWAQCFIHTSKPILRRKRPLGNPLQELLYGIKRWTREITTQLARIDGTLAAVSMSCRSVTGVRGQRRDSRVK